MVVDKFCVDVHFVFLKRACVYVQASNVYAHDELQFYVIAEDVVHFYCAAYLIGGIGTSSSMQRTTDGGRVDNVSGPAGINPSENNLTMVVA